MVEIYENNRKRVVLLNMKSTLWAKAGCFKLLNSLCVLAFLGLMVCGSLWAKEEASSLEEGIYQIGVGDQLNIYVWRNPELSIIVPVRPDGRISLPLVDDIQAAEKSPVVLAKEIEKTLSKFIKKPNVSVIVQGFGNTMQSSIKIIGGGLTPIAIPYSKNIKLLDVVIRMGTIPETADLGKVKIIRHETYSGKTKEITAKLSQLINKGDITQNIVMKRGDIVVISEKWF